MIDPNTILPLTQSVIDKISTLNRKEHYSRQEYLKRMEMIRKLLQRAKMITEKQ